MSTYEEIIGNIEVAESSPEPVVKQEEVSQSTSGTDGTMYYSLLFDHFDINDSLLVNSEVRKTLADIVSMLGSTDKTELTRRLNDIESRIGQPKLGSTRINHIYRYLKLRRTADEAFKDVSRYENSTSD